ncbi:ABC transporter permease [Streptomyces sp. SP17BM10]|uniref:ABC transporter permease n=1 Tax=Streptomyces sp. SP17BM10 TaxID=3002530 RepID=UPI002E7615EB|nr:ABC transporter permease [Streptomyces sp. SP17BM10]MEE1786421.1 ABC transporter permease [Streptomyces sp. SP17BM10]
MTTTTTDHATPTAPAPDAAVLPAADAPPPQQAVRTALRAIGVIAHRDLLRQLRRPGILVSQAVQILFFVLVYAVGFDSMIPSAGGLPFSAYVFPGIIAIQVVSIGMASGQTYAWDREYGVLRELLVAPVPRVCLPLGKVVAGAGLVTAQSAAMLAFAPLTGIPLTAARFAGALACYALTAVVFSVLGLTLATVITRVQTLQASVQLAMFPMLFLSGSVFSAADAPGWLGRLMHLNPMTYAVDATRQILLGAPGLHALSTDLAALGALLAAALVTLRLRSGR